MRTEQLSNMPGEDKKEVNDRMEEFMNDLRKGEILGSFEVTKRTVDILRRLVAHTKWTTAEELMNMVRTEGLRMMAADPSEGCIANMVRRVLKIIREEVVSLGEEGRKEPKTDDNPQDQGAVDILQSCDFTQPCPNLKGAVIESIGELITEIEGCVENVATQALEHIHADETIMTFGRSRTVEAFLKNAARKRKFQVICAEGEPFFGGQHLAKSLSEAGLSVTLIPDTHMYAMMRRVNKVILGTHTIMAEGGLKARCGTYNMALAAKDHKVPIFVCAATYKLSPEHFQSEDQPGFQKWANPSLFLPMDDLAGLEDVEVGNVLFEHVPPELIDLFIFNIGTNAPAYVYRLLKDVYHPDDVNLEV